MNTVKSFWVGWGALCVAGGGAYYFAKQSINADRQKRFEEDTKRRRIQADMEFQEATVTKSKHSGTKDKSDVRTDFVGSPSYDILAQDDLAVGGGRTPVNEGQRLREPSKYEASTPYRSKRGDRFS